MPRPKENRTTMLCRVDAGTPDRVKEIAKALGYLYNESGSIGKLMNAIANGDLILIHSKKDKT